MKAIHLFLLAAMIGVELILGVVVAPVVFYPQGLIGENVLSHFQSGLMMSDIFVKMGYVLLVVALFNALYELINFFKKKEKFQLRFSKFALSIIVLILALFFVFYFTAYILEAQKMGESVIKTAEFQSMHEASEVVIKIIVCMQIFLYFLSFKIAKKD
ncbi:DUF4149 domain-containing protein [Campylobacter upsaliensis]|nr:DUF4149 domain-containing protein [Campylobacter upsaliensis]EAK5389850.1 DUF4149 domain-containing protein [Campylobacter upsaliensis]EJF7502765.1 DUF4149 domain-containing protein [Campylobacter upsaliensis]